MEINEVIRCLENFAPSSLQEDYDNAGLLIGTGITECTGIITTLDITESVIAEAVQKKCNLVVAHHPIIFKGLKKLNGKNYVERSVIAAIQNNIAIYAIHTNLDNVANGVNKKIAQKLHLQNTKVLFPKEGTLRKLVTFAPQQSAEDVRNALFRAGAGTLGRYSECSFNTEGMGTFNAGEGADPFVGKIGERHKETETRIEVIFPENLLHNVLQNLEEAHPYEEVAYDIYALGNTRNDVGSGLTGDLAEPVSEEELLLKLKTEFGLTIIRHTSFLHKKIIKLALCGGAGSFLISAAKAAGAGAYITSDVKYHEFFDADSSIFLADIGHYESEQFTIDLLADILQQKFPNFAVLKTEIKTNPVNYYV
ncbi:MAG: Nif3-like dinuclear metal center hexameric protein [Ginsengibacter sp.]